MHMHILTHIHILWNIYIYICVYIHIYIHIICIHIYIQTYIHMHIYIYMWSSSGVLVVQARNAILSSRLKARTREMRDYRCFRSRAGAKCETFIALGVVQERNARRSSLLQGYGRDPCTARGFWASQ